MIPKKQNIETNDKKGAFFALCSSMGYGLNNPLAALGANNGVPSIYSAAFRAMLMLIVSAVLLKSTNRGFYLAKNVRKSVATMAITTTIISLCYVGSINFISVSLAAIIFFTFPIQILLYSIIFKKKRIYFIEIFVFIFIFIGLILVIAPNLSNINLMGVFLAFISSISATFLYLVGSFAAKNSEPILIGFWIHILAFPIIALVSYIIYNFIEINTLQMLYPMIIMACCYVMAYYFQILSLKYTSPIISSLFFNAEPIMTGLAAAIILEEKLMPLQYLGVCFVFSALMLNSMRKNI